MNDTLKKQIGGEHYKNMAIQPIEFLKACLTPEEFRGYIKGTAMVYLARQKDDTDQDIAKAMHTLELYLSLLITGKNNE
ncbi:hypothetical protein [Caudoviricetes sp.]|nr:hypothetical protein [Caudoviricetes sp.]